MMKSKVKLTLNLLLILILSLSLFSVFPLDVRAQGDEWLDGYDYRRQIVVDQTSGAGIGYEVGAFDLRWNVGTDSGDIIYFNGTCQEDFDDIRYTRADGETLLDYAFISKTDGVRAVTYFECAADLDLDDAYVYLYWGNSTVSSTASLDDTFVDYVQDDVALACKCDEGSGSTVVDYAHWNNGSSVSLSYISGRFGYALSNFSQSYNSSVTFADSDYLSFGDDGFTWLLWANWTKTSFPGGQEWGTIWAKDNFVYEYWNTYFSTNAQHIRLADLDFASSNGQTVTANEWHYNGIRWNGSYVDYFINGSYNPASSEAWATGFSGSTQTQDLLIGQVPLGAYSFEGDIDEILMINASLTNTQMSNFASYYPDVDVQSGDVYVRKRYLATDPTWTIGTLETAEEAGIGEFATKGFVFASAIAGVMMIVIIGLPVMFLVVRRRRKK